VTCTRRQNVRSWLQLERALILAFKDRFGEKPKCNVQGKKYRWRKRDRALFSRRRLGTVVEDLS
jgi:hypothetical protein